MREVIKGPGIQIELDASEIYPDDPGLGTPAMVIERGGKRRSASYEAALNHGELDCGEVRLNQSQINWLGDQFETVEAFFDKHEA